MKILVLSDAHANIWALQAIMKKEKSYDILAFAGDMVDYGTAPSEVITWFRKAENTCIVQGNHDLHAVQIAHGIYSNEAERYQYKWIHYNLERMTEDQVTYLENLPESDYFRADGYVYLVKHQYRTESYDVIENRTQYLDFWRGHVPKEYWEAPKKRIIFGHNHRQGIHVLDEGMEWMNPGSISYRRPDDPEKNAQYMVITDGKTEIKKISYDRSALYHEALIQKKRGQMLVTEIQDFMFFFGDAKTSREPLEEETDEKNRE